MILWLKKQTPKLKKQLNHPWLARWHHDINHIGLWSLTRRPLARGVAIGLFCAFIPGPLQMLSATFLSIWLRGHIGAALIGTWVTNPFTIVPLYAMAATFGQFMLGGYANNDANLPASPVWVMFVQGFWHSVQVWINAWFAWFIGLGPSLALGLPLLACLLAGAGYVLTHLLWRIWIHTRRKKYFTKNKPLSPTQ